jgi:hypothetical protein
MNIQKRVQPQAQFGSRVAFTLPVLAILNSGSSSSSSSSLIVLLAQHDAHSLKVRVPFTI